MADTKYAPCPFCGGTNMSVCERDYLHFVMCGNCTAEGPAMEGVGSETAAVKEWNRRSTSSVSEGEMPEWIILQKPGCVPELKGPLTSTKQTEDMLRELYDIHPGCICTLAAMPRTSYPQSGREWIDMYGDKRRKALPPEARAATKAAAPADRRTVAVPVEAYLWLMGLGRDAFTEDRNGAFWWRGAFNDRAGLDMMAIYQASKGRAPAEDAREEVPPPPTLPKYLLSLIGDYGMARTETVRTLEIQYRWEKLIEGIKRYATDYANLARRASSVPAIPGTGREKEQAKPFGYWIVESHDLPYPGSGFVRELTEGRKYHSVTPLFAPSHPLEAKAGEKP